jgi:DNA mismatch repair protein MutH
MGTWKRRLGRAVTWLIVLVAILYAGDWIVLRMKVARGTAFGSVPVNQFLATPLKGNKVEYDFTGTVLETCSRSIFPQQGNPACWWLQRHTSQWE